MGLPNGHVAESIDLTGLEQALSSSSTKQRRAGLNILSKKLTNSEYPQDIDVRTIDILFATYPYYTDRPSRRAVQECLQADCLYPPHTARLIDLFQKEASKPGLAASNAFVLVEWGSVLLQHVAHTGAEAFNDHGIKIVQAHARALDLVLSSHLKARASVHTSALVVTRRALRKLFRAIGEPAIKTIVGTLTAKGQPLGLKSASFLGVVAGVCARLPKCKPVLSGQKQDYDSFYIREILGSKTQVPSHLAYAIKDYFENFPTVEELGREIIPAMEKALLRAPEVVLNDLITPLFTSLPLDMDMSPILANHLCRPLLSNLKSSNVGIRDGAISAFGVLIGRSKAHSELGRVLDDLIIPMSSSKLTAEHRALHARIMAMIPPVGPKSGSICESLCVIVGKEPNEAAVAGEVSTLLCQSRDVPEGSAVFKTVISACVKGLSDKRPIVRRHWMLCVGKLLWEYCNKNAPQPSALAQLTAECLPCFFAIMDEVVQNPVTAISSGSAVGALIALTLSQKFLVSDLDAVKGTIRKAKVMEKMLSVNSKTAVLLSPRVYTRLAEVDLSWQIRALAASSRQVYDEQGKDVRLAWAHGVIYLIAGVDHSKTRELAMGTLTELYMKEPSHISSLIIDGLWAWYRHVEANEKETAAVATKIGNSRLHFVVRSICPAQSRNLPNSETDRAGMQKQLTDMLVLCRPELLPHVHWIDVCLRVGEDPGLIAERKAVQCFERIEKCLDSQGDIEPSINVRQAAYNTAERRQVHQQVKPPGHQAAKRKARVRRAASLARG